MRFSGTYVSGDTIIMGVYSVSFYFFADLAPVLLDIWFVRDNFLADSFSKLSELTEEAIKDCSQDKFYMQEYYNIHGCFELAQSGVQRVTARIINLLIAACNKFHKLPRFIVVMPDKDLLCDMDVFHHQVQEILKTNVDWMVRHISITIHRKKAELLDKKPGSLYAGHPAVIFIRMIRCPSYGLMGKSRSYRIYELRSKFNEALNDAVGQSEHRIRTVNSCTTNEHFDNWGNLSSKGKKALWYEIDDLLEHFDLDNIKLLSAPSTIFPMQPDVSSGIQKYH